MTKKHFVAVAKILRAALLANLVEPREHALLVEGFADYFASVNPAFSYPRFRFACGVSEDLGPVEDSAVTKDLAFTREIVASMPKTYAY